MKMAFYILSLVLLSMVSSLAYASDPSPLQDFCVADPSCETMACVPQTPLIRHHICGSKECALVFVNGRVCKDPKLVKANDFFLRGLKKPGNTANNVGSNVTQANVGQIAGLNTLGISLVRTDFAPYGINAPHTHPRATEILTVLEGTLYVGFVTFNPENRLITKVLNRGDVFVFPVNLIHFQFNVGKTKAVAIASLSSQNPGTITIADAVFGSNPPISDDILAKAFQVDKKIIDAIQAKF